MNSESNQILAQIDEVNAENPNLTALGTFPAPSTPASIIPARAPLQAGDIDISLSNTDSVTFNVQFVINNNSATSITIDSIVPKFYFNDISGLDISNEFNTSTTQDFSDFTIAANSQATVIYKASHANPHSNGNAIIDTFLNYSPTGEENEIHLNRSFSESSWVSITDTDSITIVKDLISNDILPSHISLYWYSYWR